MPDCVAVMQQNTQHPVSPADIHCPVNAQTEHHIGSEYRLRRDVSAYGAGGNGKTPRQLFLRQCFLAKRIKHLIQTGIRKLDHANTAANLLMDATLRKKIICRTRHAEYAEAIYGPTLH